MNRSYFSTLDSKSRSRYLDKLMFQDQSLPDPLDQCHKHLFINDVKKWPKVHYIDIYQYLVEKECAYTKEAMRNFKALECMSYVHSGKVKEILIYQPSALEVCVLKSKVESSQTLGKYNYPWVVVKKEGEVISAHCTCMAGLGEVCSHVAAVLFTIEAAIREGINNPSCTSESCKWISITKTVKACPVAEIDFSTKKKKKGDETVTSCYVPVQRTLSSEKEKDFLNAWKNVAPSAALFTMISDSETDTASEGESESGELDEIEIEDFISFCKKIGDVYKYSEPDEKMFLIKKSLKMNDCEVQVIERSTREQYRSSLWRKQHVARITSSMFGKVSRCKGAYSKIISDILGYVPGFECQNTHWGISNEPIARAKFIDVEGPQHVNFDVQSTGILINKDDPFLGASPDGLVSCDCCAQALLEIKCPASAKKLKICEITKKGFYLDNSGNLLQTHEYYAQVQGQMGIWGFSRCYFVVYTEVDMTVEVIEFNEEYWNTLKEKLSNFFFSRVLPEILTGDLLKNLTNAATSCTCKTFKACEIVICNICKCVFHKTCMSVSKKNLFFWKCKNCPNN